MISGVAIACLWVLYIYPIAVLSGLIVTIACVRNESYNHTQRKLALAATRPGNPLCSFARALDLRSVDPWVVRATFEELQPYFPEKAQPFPFRPTDKMVEDLSIDPDEIDEIAQTIADRAGYSLENTEQNPLYGKVETVGELIQFFTHLPRPSRRMPTAALAEG